MTSEPPDKRQRPQGHVSCASLSMNAMASDRQVGPSVDPCVGKRFGEAPRLWADILDPGQGSEVGGNPVGICTADRRAGPRNAVPGAIPKLGAPMLPVSDGDFCPQRDPATDRSNKKVSPPIVKRDPGRQCHRGGSGQCPGCRRRQGQSMPGKYVLNQRIAKGRSALHPTSAAKIPILRVDQHDARRMSDHVAGPCVHARKGTAQPSRPPQVILIGKDQWHPRRSLDCALGEVQEICGNSLPRSGHDADTAGVPGRKPPQNRAGSIVGTVVPDQQLPGLMLLFGDGIQLRRKKPRAVPCCHDDLNNTGHERIHR